MLAAPGSDDQHVEAVSGNDFTCARWAEANHNFSSFLVQYPIIGYSRIPPFCCAKEVFGAGDLKRIARQSAPRFLPTWEANGAVPKELPY
jgi:hypothetical protein